MLVYRLSQAAVTVYYHLYHRLTVVGKEHVPRTGGIILAPNHESFLDPPLMGAAFLHRQVAFIAKSELGEGSLLRWYINSVGSVFIRRGAVNLELEREVLARLRAGACICVFPEGTRTRTGQLGRGKAGVGRLVLLAGVPVVPVHIRGTRAAWPPGGKVPLPAKVTVTAGAPLTFETDPRPEKARCQQVADELLGSIRRLGAPPAPDDRP